MVSYNKKGIGRFYITPYGDFPSVTTVLGAYEDKTWLQEWRARIGNDEADRITKESTDIGTYLHYLFECFLSNVEARKPETPEEKKAEQLFKISKQKLTNIVNDVLYLETPVWSKELRVAGRFDCLCLSKDKKITLLDFKNSRKGKTKNEIDSYRQQLGFYTIMIKETLGIDVEISKIYMVNRDGFVQIFNFKKEETPFEELVTIRRTFFEKYGY